MGLGIVDIYDFVRPPLESHEDMNHMSDDWSWPIRMMLSIVQGDLFGGLGRTIGILGIVLKDKRSLAPWNPWNP